LIDLFRSKKFFAAVTAIAIYIAGRFGFKLDTTTLDRIYAALLVYVGAQGIADNGKSAAAIAAAASNPPASTTAVSNPPTSTAAPTRPIAAGVGSAALLLLAVFGVSMLTACGPRTKAIESAVWDCTAPERAEAVSVLTPVLESVIEAAASGDRSKIDLSSINTAISKANLLSDAGVMLSCAVASAFAALEQPTPPAPPTTTVPNANATQHSFDPTALRAAFDQLRATHFPGATFKTRNGNV
jgi:hypothetical protein